MTGITPNVIAVPLAAMIMVLSGGVPLDNVYRVISWPTVVLIAATLPLSTALDVTGGAQLIVDILVNTLGAMGPVILMAGIFLLTAAFSQVISNTATTVLLRRLCWRRGDHGRVAVSPADHGGCRGVVRLPHADCLAGQHAGDGAGWLSLQRLRQSGVSPLAIALLLSLVLAPLIWPL